MSRSVRTGVAGVPGLGNVSLTANTIGTASTNTNLNLSGTGTGGVTTADPVVVTNATAGSALAGAFITAGGMGIAGDLWVGGGLNGGTGLSGVTIGNVTPAAANFTTLSVSGTTTLSEVVEQIVTKTGATGTVTHDFTESNTWYHTSIAANFTVNLTNVPTTDNRTIIINLHLIQGSTPYFATAFQIDGVAQTINWTGSVYPQPQANATEIQTFSLFRVGSAWTVSSFLETNDAGPVRTNLRAYYDAGLASSAPTGSNGSNWVDISGSGSALGNVSVSGTDFSYSTSLGIGTVYGNTTRANINSAGIPVSLTNFSKSKGTFEFWVYHTEYTGSNGYFINRSDTTANDNNWFWIGAWSNGDAAYFRIGQSGGSANCCNNDNSWGNGTGSRGGYNGVFPLNTWHQVCFTWDLTLDTGQNYSAWWKNGKMIQRRNVSDDIDPTTNVSSTGRFFQGHENASGTQFRGHCSIIRYYNTPLTSAQIMQNFNANRARHGL